LVEACSVRCIKTSLTKTTGDEEDVAFLQRLACTAQGLLALNKGEWGQDQGNEAAVAVIHVW